MEKHVDGMGARRVQAEKLAIESMRQPGDRVPVQRFGGVKGPNDGIPGDSGTNPGIVGNIRGVVEIEKWSAGDRVIECNRCQSQQQAEDYPALLRGMKDGGLRRELVGLRLGGLHGTLADSRLFRRRSGAVLVARSVLALDRQQIFMQQVERIRRYLRTPLVDFFFFPMAIEAERGVGEVLGKREPVNPCAQQHRADLPPLLVNANSTSPSSP